MVSLQKFWDNLKIFFQTTLSDNYVSCILEFLFCVVIFYCIFKVLQINKASKFIPLVIYFTLLGGFTFALTEFDSTILLILIAMMALLIFTMFHTEIKRNLLDSNIRKKSLERLSVSAVELIIEETTRAVQSMSKKDIGALIVLSNGNLPEGIIESGTVVNADITAQMLEAIFYPKAPLHDGATIIEGNKIYAAGCFLPLAQSENLPKEMGSRHRAALGVTTVASVTAIVVSEETGIISIVRNGSVYKKYADATDLKGALADYYWSDLAVEGKV